jgi:nucleotide-binding universal stress UspA family protein
MSIGNVLFGTDFTESAGNAISRIAWLPISRGSSVTVVHALPRRLPARYLAAFQRGASHKLELTRQELLASERRDFEVFTALDEGHPTEVVCRRAHDEEAQLIVVGRGRQRRLVLVGSTAERVARASDTATLVVATPARGPYQRPLVAIDRTAQALEVLGFAQRLAGTAPLTVVHAFLAHGSDLGRMLRDSGMGEGEVSDYIRSAEHEARRDIESMVHKVAGAQPVEIVLSEGDARDAILDEAHRRDADLVVVGTSGHSPIARLLLGSVAEEVLRAAPCDVLVAR